MSNTAYVNARNCIYGIIVDGTSLFCVVRDESSANEIKNILENIGYDVELRSENVKERNFESRYKQFTLSSAMDISTLEFIRSHLKDMALIFGNHFQKKGEYVHIGKNTESALKDYVDVIGESSRTIKRCVFYDEDVDINLLAGFDGEKQKYLTVICNICTLLLRRINIDDVLNVVCKPSPLNRTQIEPSCAVEAFTKYAVIEPLLTALGYDSYYPEGYTLSGKRVDYVVPSVNEKTILIEAKCLGSDFFKRKGAKNQTMDYINDWAGSAFGIVSDGLRWMIISEYSEGEVPKTLFLVDMRYVFEEVIKVISGQKEMLDHVKVEHLLDGFIELLSKDNVYEAERILCRSPMKKSQLANVRNHSRKTIK